MVAVVAERQRGRRSVSSLRRNTVRRRRSRSDSDDLGCVDDLNVGVRNQVTLDIRNSKRIGREGSCNECGTHIDELDLGDVGRVRVRLFA